MLDCEHFVRTFLTETNTGLVNPQTENSEQIAYN